MSATNDQTHIGGANTWPDLPFNEWYTDVADPASDSGTGSR
jgi:hypothetical protein